MEHQLVAFGDKKTRTTTSNQNEGEPQQLMPELGDQHGEEPEKRQSGKYPTFSSSGLG